MAIKKTATTEKSTKNKPPYLTKRILISAAKKGIRKAAEETMQIMGYNVIARDGWVVKLFADGTIEKITPIKREKTPNGIVLD